MNPALNEKLVCLSQRYQKLNQLLSDPQVLSDQAKYAQYAKEFAQLQPVVEAFHRYLAQQDMVASTAAMLREEPDESMRQLIAEELHQLQDGYKQIDQEIKQLLLPQDPNDQCNVFVEIRAGTGGDEAGLFSGDLLRMYLRYAEIKQWKTEIMSASENEQGGFKCIIIRIIGQQVYSRLKFESGAHRVQRVPETETQGRIHTSTCTVAVLPEMDRIEDIDINPAELRVDTFRASGAGGQHINKTDSAIRITHLPSGMVVECQDERSQHKNRARAMKLLHAKLLSFEQEKQHQAQAQTRRNLVGTGDRSERIRTYNFPQSRITDHRIQLTLHKLEEILLGQVDHLIEPLIRAHQADQLTAMESD